MKSNKAAGNKGSGKQVVQAAKAPVANSEVISGADVSSVAAAIGDNTPVAVVVVTQPAGSAPAATHDVPSNAGATTITTVAGKSKSQVAQAIFRECYAQTPVPQRKDIIARAIAATGLSPAGAATYLQNYKSKHGLTKTAQAAASVATA